MLDVRLTDIEMDTGIQCRAAINPATVNDYATQMRDAVEFPAVELFATNGRYWIGDGWHRIMAAQQIGALTIRANEHEGGRHKALVFALGANAAHGQRRTNADKRRCVEIALTEFGNLSSRAIAEICGVGHQLVLAVRPEVDDSSTSHVNGVDGKQYPAKRQNGVETVTAESPPFHRNSPRAEKAKVIASMLGEGHNVVQIAAALGYKSDRSQENVREIIREFNLTVPYAPKGASGTKRMDPTHVITETVNAASATVHGLRLIRHEAIDLPKDEAAAMLSELREALQSLRWLEQLLKGIVNG